MEQQKNGVYFIINENNSHNGITDRLKAIVGLYYIAKQNNVGFHLIHTAGFDIREYLKPNKVDWSASLSDISVLPWRRRQLEYRPPYTGIPELKSGLQYICRRYIGKNNIEMLNVPEWERIWRESFWDLFLPSERILDALSEAGMPDHYTAVNVRFINSLGFFEQTDYNSPLPEEEKIMLIETVLKKVAACEKESELPIVVSSDSVCFLEAAAERGFRTIDRKGIGHVMFLNADEDIYFKTFVNFFLLAQADKVISILNLEGFPKNCLYKTQYPRYAAIVGDKPFVRI